MPRRKLTPGTIEQICEAIKEMSARDQRIICAAFDAALDELAGQDAFGTEMQLDPRGDPRE